MHTMLNIRENWKRYLTFGKDELQAMLISIVVMAFAITFRNWDLAGQPDLGTGLKNLLGAILVLGFSFFFRQSFQKAWALMADLKVEYKMWSYGLLITLVAAFITNGWVWFIIPGTIIVHYMAGMRLGWSRYGLNYFAIGTISMSGPIATVLCAMIFRALDAFYPNPLFHKAFLFNVYWSLWAMLPIPPARAAAPCRSAW